MSIAGAGHGEAAAVARDGLDTRPGHDLDAVAGEFIVDERAEFGVEGGEHLGASLELGDGHAAGDEGFGHLQADIAGADDDRRGRLPRGEVVVEGEGVAHRVDHMHPIRRGERVEAGDAGVGRKRTGADDELVVGDLLLGPVLAADGEPLACDVDARGEGVQPQAHPGGLQVGGGAVGEGLPGLHFAGEVVGDAADGEVRVGVGHDDGDVDRGVEFAGAQGCGDAGVTSADRYEVHEGAFQDVVSGCVGTTTSPGVPAAVG